MPEKTICPACGASLTVPEGQEIVQCNYCGNQFSVHPTESGHELKVHAQPEPQTSELTDKASQVLDKEIDAAAKNVVDQAAPGDAVSVEGVTVFAVQSTPPGDAVQPPAESEPPEDLSGSNVPKPANAASPEVDQNDMIPNAYQPETNAPEGATVFAPANAEEQAPQGEPPQEETAPTPSEPAGGFQPEPGAAQGATVYAFPTSQNEGPAPAEQPFGLPSTEAYTPPNTDDVNQPSAEPSYQAQTVLSSGTDYSAPTVFSTGAPGEPPPTGTPDQPVGTGAPPSTGTFPTPPPGGAQVYGGGPSGGGTGVPPGGTPGGVPPNKSNTGLIIAIVVVVVLCLLCVCIAVVYAFVNGQFNFNTGWLPLIAQTMAVV